MKVDMHNISQRCRLANEYKIKSRITMKQLRYRDDSVKSLVYNLTLHIFCITQKDVYLFLYLLSVLCYHPYFVSLLVLFYYPYISFCC